MKEKEKVKKHGEREERQKQGLKVYQLMGIWDVQKTFL